MKKSKPLDLSAVSPGVKVLNPHLYKATGRPIPGVCLPVEPLLPDLGQDAAKKASKGKKRKEMNQTEREFSLILESQKQRSELSRWEYEGLTLRWGTIDNIQYTPDFTVFPREGLSPYFIEVKGAHIWAKDMQKFKAARNEWPMFQFQLWQRTKENGWQQLL